MGDLFYPALTLEQIQAVTQVLQLMEENGSYLDSAACPYPVKIKNALWRLKQADELSKNEPVVNVEEFDHLHELVTLYQSMKGSGVGLDPDARMGYYKTATSLLDKILDLIKISEAIKERRDFEGTILKFLSEVCNEKQREEFMQKVEAHLKA